MNAILKLDAMGDMRPGAERILDHIGRALQLQMLFYALLAFAVVIAIVVAILLVVRKPTK